MRQPDNTLLDVYIVDVKGGEKATLCLDGYRWSDPVAPKGFLCGTPMNLAPPGPDPFETTRQLTAFAIQLGANEVDPIPLDADGSNAHGVISQAPAPPPPGKSVPAEGARIVMQIFVAPDGSALNPAFVSGDYESRPRPPNR